MLYHRPRPGRLVYQRHLKRDGHALVDNMRERDAPKDLVCKQPPQVGTVFERHVHLHSKMTIRALEGGDDSAERVTAHVGHGPHDRCRRKRG